MPRKIRPKLSGETPPHVESFRFGHTHRAELLRRRLVPDEKIAALEELVTAYRVDREMELDQATSAETKASLKLAKEKAKWLARWLTAMDEHAELAIYLANKPPPEPERGRIDKRELAGQLQEYSKIIAEARRDVHAHARGGRPRKLAQQALVVRVAALLKSIGKDVDKRPNGTLALMMEIVFEALGEPKADVLNIIRPILYEIDIDDSDEAWDRLYGWPDAG